MSQLLGRMGKLSWSSIGKQGLCFSELSTAATPYLLLKETNHRIGASGERIVADINLYDPRKDERVKIPEQSLSEELYASTRIGSSRGWVGMKNRTDSTIRLTNIFNPCASVSSHKVISLPPLDGRISRFSLSASPDQQQEDCVVAVKYASSSLSLCRPGDLEWTSVKVPFFASDLMYSGKDRRFLLHRSRTDEYDGPIDLIDTSCCDFPQVSLHQRFTMSHDIPKSRQDVLISTYNTQLLAESPSGDSFIVYWCKEWLKNEDIVGDRPPYKPSHRRETRAFVVFRQDSEQRIASYTEDIGDLCIFLGGIMSEAFCLSATEYPGLNPNSVYFASIDMGSGFYDLSSNTLHHLVIDPTSCSWLAPLH